MCVCVITVSSRQCVHTEAYFCELRILCTESQNGITLIPSTNQTVAFGSDDNVTYYCNVTAGQVGGRTALWDFGGVQIRPGSDFADAVLQDGLIIEAGASPDMARITVTRTAREIRFPNRDLALRCAAVEDENVDIEFGGTVYVRTFSKYSMWYHSYRYKL